VAAAAKRLGLGRATLYRKMAALGLTGRGRLKLATASPPHQE
jgi:DNA-binding NtrC family response regulator